MEIGVKFEGHDNDCRYLGFSKYLNNGRDGICFPTDVKLSPEIQRALELTKPIWTKSSSIPLAYVDSGNHGYRIGLVFNAAEFEGIIDHETMHDFVRRELIARVSVGGSRKKTGYETKEDSLGNEVDFSNPNRVHVSVLGRRHFFPKEWRNLPYENDGWGRRVDKRFVTPVVEEVHVSMRWIDGKFNDWNNPEEWYKGFSDRSLGAQEFSKMRTTYCVAYPKEVSQKHSTEGEKSDNIKELIKREGRRRQIIDLSPEIRQFKGRYQHANKMLEKVLNDGIQLRVPVIGFQEVRGAAGLDNVDGMYDNQIAQMTPEQGVEYLFGKVMPAIDDFTRK